MADEILAWLFAVATVFLLWAAARALLFRKRAKTDKERAGRWRDFWFLLIAAAITLISGVSLFLIGWPGALVGLAAAVTGLPLMYWLLSSDNQGANE